MKSYIWHVVLVKMTLLHSDVMDLNAVGCSIYSESQPLLHYTHQPRRDLLLGVLMGDI